MSVEQKDEPDWKRRLVWLADNVPDSEIMDAIAAIDREVERLRHRIAILRRDRKVNQ